MKLLRLVFLAACGNAHAAHNSPAPAYPINERPGLSEVYTHNAGPLVAQSLAPYLPPNALRLATPTLAYENEHLRMELERKDWITDDEDPTRAFLRIFDKSMPRSKGAVFVMKVDPDAKVVGVIENFRKVTRERFVELLKRSPGLPLVGQVLATVQSAGGASVRHEPEPGYAKEARWKDLRVFAEYEEGRKFVRPATRKIVNATIDSVVAHGTPILEIGSGLGELARLLPEDRRRLLTETDGSPEFLKLNAASRSPRRMAASIDALPFPSGSIPAIAGFAVLDTVLDLPRAARELFRVLKPGGALVHFLDLAPEFFVELEGMTAKGLVAFPQGDGFLLASREALERNQARVPPPLRPWLADALEDPVTTALRLRAAEPAVAGELSAALKNAGLIQGEIPSTMDHFKARIEGELSGAGFAVSSNYEKQLLLLDRSASPYDGHAENAFDLDLGKFFKGRIAWVEAGKVLVYSRLFVLKAKKPL